MDSKFRNFKLNRRLVRAIKIVISVTAILSVGIFFIVVIAVYSLLSSSGKNNLTNDRGVSQSPRSIGVMEHKIYETMGPSDSNEKPELNLSRQKLDRERRFKQQYKFMKEIAVLREDSRFESASPLCDILCSESTWQNREENVELWDHFNSFLEREGSRAFEDPEFRLAFETANSFADIMIAVEKVMEQFEPVIDKKSELSESEKIYLSAKAPFLIANLASEFSNLIPQSKKQSKVVAKLIKLRKQCGSLSSVEIEKSCRVISEGVR